MTPPQKKIYIWTPAPKYIYIYFFFPSELRLFRIFGIILVLLSASFARLSGPPLTEIIPRINFMQSQSISSPVFLHPTLSVSNLFSQRKGFVITSLSQRYIYVDIIVVFLSKEGISVNVDVLCQIICSHLPHL